jgi:hypothetical protein
MRSSCALSKTQILPPDFGRMVGNPSMIRSPSSKLGLDPDSVIHRGLNSLLEAKIAFGGLH